MFILFYNFCMFAFSRFSLMKELIITFARRVLIFELHIISCVCTTAQNGSMKLNRMKVKSLRFVLSYWQDYGPPGIRYPIRSWNFNHRDSLDHNETDLATASKCQQRYDICVGKGCRTLTWNRNKNMREVLCDQKPSFSCSSCFSVLQIWHKKNVLVIYLTQTNQ
jgi:hypothetical protein